MSSALIKEENNHQHPWSETKYPFVEKVCIMIILIFLGFSIY